jgi:hypothetical protein
MKKIAIITTIIIVSVIFVIKSWTHEIDNYGTKEIDLVNSAGKTVCMSCIGLSDESIVTYILDFFRSDSGEEEK